MWKRELHSPSAQETAGLILDLDDKDPIPIPPCHNPFIQPDTIVVLAENRNRPTTDLDRTRKALQ